jgi:hypothetical protein
MVQALKIHFQARRRRQQSRHAASIAPLAHSKGGCHERIEKARTGDGGRRAGLDPPVHPRSGLTEEDDASECRATHNASRHRDKIDIFSDEQAQLPPRPNKALNYRRVSGGALADGNGKRRSAPSR